MSSSSEDAAPPVVGAGGLLGPATGESETFGHISGADGEWTGICRRFPTCLGPKKNNIICIAKANR